MKKIEVAGVALALFASGLLLAGCGKSSKANKMEPAEYYSYIENKSIEEGLKSTKSSISYEDGFDGNFDLKLSLFKEGKELIKTYAGAMAASGSMSDLDWLDSISLNGNIAVNKGAMSAKMTGGVNNAKINLDAVMNEESACLRVPELNKSFISLPSSFLGGMSGLDVGAIVKSYTEYLTAIPSNAEIASEVNKYKNAYLKYATDVSKSTSNVTKGGSSQEFTVLTVNFEGDNAKNMVKEILTLAKDDECIKKFLQSMENFQRTVNSYNSNDGFTYSKFAETVESLLEDIDEYGLGDFSNFKMDIFVNSKDEICGRAFKLEESEVASYVLTRDGKKFGFDLSANIGGNSFNVAGDGTCKGSLYTGEYTLSAGSNEIQKITIENFDAAAAKKGIAKGTLKFTPAQFAAYQVVFDFVYGNSDAKYALSLLQDSKKLATLDYNTKISKGSAIKLPSDAVKAEGEEEIMNYVKALKFGELNKIVKKVGLPKEYEDQITGAVDGLSKQFAE